MILRFIKGITACRLKEEKANLIKKIFTMNILHHSELRKRDCEKAIVKNDVLKR